ncbi:hypothetical protein BN903_69 [Halorubrum sp. AJ67]|nr:hypothetical protein BN903_69 [Halorubrum sp. AJ67]
MSLEDTVSPADPSSASAFSVGDSADSLADPPCDSLIPSLYV